MEEIQSLKNVPAGSDLRWWAKVVGIPDPAPAAAELAPSRSSASAARGGAMVWRSAAAAAQEGSTRWRNGAARGSSGGTMVRPSMAAADCHQRS
jgi:hypothetical protein